MPALARPAHRWPVAVAVFAAAPEKSISDLMDALAQYANYEMNKMTGSEGSCRHAQISRVLKDYVRPQVRGDEVRVSIEHKPIEDPSKESLWGNLDNARQMERSLLNVSMHLDQEKWSQEGDR